MVGDAAKLGEQLGGLLDEASEKPENKANTTSARRNSMKGGKLNKRAAALQKEEIRKKRVAAIVGEEEKKTDVDITAPERKPLAELQLGVASANDIAGEELKVRTHYRELGKGPADN